MFCFSHCGLWLAFSQAKKPTIMVVPADNWCIKNHYVQTFEELGKTKEVPDYQKALQLDSDMLLAISKIGEMMAQREFPLKNLESCLKTVENQSSEDALLTSKSGEAISESPIDRLKKTAKADILLQLNYTINHIGPRKSLTFNLQGIDAYTDKQIAAASGTSDLKSPTMEMAIMLEEAVLMHIDNFNEQLKAYFDNLFEMGREITVRIKVWNSFEDGLEREFDGVELGEIIEKWMAENTVQGRFNTSEATENMMLFEQVRIPMEEVSDNGSSRALDARSWVGKLRKFLRKQYDIESKLMMQGLGQAQLVIGEK